MSGPTRPSDLPSKTKIIFDSTLEAISHTRRILVFISVLLFMGVFHAFLWYSSWDLARVAARRGVANALAADLKVGRYHLGSRAGDVQMVKAMRTAADEIEEKLTAGDYKLPLIGVSVAAADFSSALLMLAVGSLLWLFFFHRRLNDCLEALTREEGYGRSEAALRYKFVLISPRPGEAMKVVARLLPAGLGIMAFGFLVSDMVDVAGFRGDSLRALAFRSAVFRERVAARLITDLVLALLVMILSQRCYSEFKETERRLLPPAHSDAEDAASAEEVRPTGRLKLVARWALRLVPRPWRVRV